MSAQNGHRKPWKWDEGQRKEQWALSDLGGGAGGLAEVWARCGPGCFMGLFF